MPHWDGVLRRATTTATRRPRGTHCSHWPTGGWGRGARHWPATAATACGRWPTVCTTARGRRATSCPVRCPSPSGRPNPRYRSCGSSTFVPGFSTSAAAPTDRPWRASASCASTDRRPRSSGRRPPAGTGRAHPFRRPVRAVGRRQDPCRVSDGCASRERPAPSGPPVCSPGWSFREGATRPPARRAVVDRVVAVHARADALPGAADVVDAAVGAAEVGFDRLLASHRRAWARRWEDADVVVEGDDDLQRGDPLLPVPPAWARWPTPARRRSGPVA